MLEYYISLPIYVQYIIGFTVLVLVPLLVWYIGVKIIDNHYK